MGEPSGTLTLSDVDTLLGVWGEEVPVFIVFFRISKS